MFKHINLMSSFKTIKTKVTKAQVSLNPHLYLTFCGLRRGGEGYDAKEGTGRQ